MHALRSTVLLMTIPLAAGAAEAQAPSAAPHPDGTWEWRTHQGESGARRYRLFVPASADPSRPAPLVLLLHGCTQDPDDLARGTRFNAAAAERGVIVAYPEQTAVHNPQKCWSWYDPAHQGRGAGEPAILAGIAREVMARQRVDPARVYVAGISAGGAMAVNVAAAYPELFAAVGVHSGVPYRVAGSVPEALSVMRDGAFPGRGMEGLDSLAAPLRAAFGGRRMPLITFHGRADRVLNAVNGGMLVEQWLRAHGWWGTRHTIAMENGYQVTRSWLDDPDDPRAEPPIRLLEIADLGHAWSGGSPEGSYTDPKGPDATREILAFLLAHARR